MKKKKAFVVVLNRDVGFPVVRVFYGTVIFFYCPCARGNGRGGGGSDWELDRAKVGSCALLCATSVSSHACA